MKVMYSYLWIQSAYFDTRMNSQPKVDNNCRFNPNYNS